jgi:hypothetical protein
MKFLLVQITWLERHTILMKSNLLQAPHKIHSSCFQQYSNKMMIWKLSFIMVQVSWLRWVITSYYENALRSLQQILNIYVLVNKFYCMCLPNTIKIGIIVTFKKQLNELCYVEAKNSCYIFFNICISLLFSPKYISHQKKFLIQS